MSDENAYMLGQEHVYMEIMRLCVARLGMDDRDKSALIMERTDTVAALHRLCDMIGAPNDWPDNLHLADVVEKRVIRYLSNIVPNPLYPNPDSPNEFDGIAELIEDED